MQRREIVWLGLVLIAGTAVGIAADKIDPTGTWKYKIQMNNQDLDITLKLKLEGDKLSGTVGRDNMETKIEDATIKGDEIAYSVNVERDGRKFTSKYKGKITGDVIKGKREFTREGQTQSVDWEAKREKK